MLRLMGLWAGTYPIVAHLGLWASLPRLVVGYLVGLLLVVLLFPPRYRQAGNIVTAIILIAAVYALVVFDLDYMIIYLPPVVIPAGLLVIFVQSLREKNIPMITQFSMIIEGDLDIERKDYTRRITQLWAGVFAFMVLEGVGLAVWTPMEMWSWATHIGNYILIASILLIEFIYRRHRFKSNNMDFRQFIIALVNHRWK